MVNSLSIDDGEVSFTIDNQGRASTQNATLQYVDGDKVLWESKNFTANASSSVSVSSSGFDEEGGEWRLHYQKRVVHSSQWVNESVNLNPQVTTLLSESVEILLWILQAGAIPVFVVAFAFWWSREEKPFDLDEETPLEAELLE